jgi:hypothetical protein
VARLPVGTRAIAAALLVVVAILGYLAGHRGAPAPVGVSSSSAAGSRVVSVADVLLEVPQHWLRAGAPQSIPGLALEGPLTLAPGAASTAGLVGGRSPGGQASPLPASFLRTLSIVPHAEVLTFLGGQAYAYTGVRIPGYDRTLNLYVVPTTSESTGPTLLACYAANGFAAQLAQCEQIVARLTLVGSTQSDLAPDPRYGGQLRGVVGALDGERLALRRQMRVSATPAGVGVLATKLAAALGKTATSVAAIEPPIAAGAAQASLAAALLAARSAYQALASAASTEQLATYDLALARVEHAEHGIDAALETFALIGYGRP